MRATCSYVMTLRGCFLSSSRSCPDPPSSHPLAVVVPLCAHAKGTDIVADLVLGETGMRTCNYLDTLLPCRSYVIPSNRARRSESRDAIRPAARSFAESTRGTLSCRSLFALERGGGPKLYRKVFQNYRDFSQVYG